MKTALITGVTGQDGSFLAEFLVEKGYEVHGTIRRSSVDFRERIAHLEGHPAFHLHYADLGDSTSISQVVKKCVPMKFIILLLKATCRCHLILRSLRQMWMLPEYYEFLEAVRQNDLTDTCRIYQASTSELYGKVEEVPQDEKHLSSI